MKIAKIKFGILLACLGSCFMTITQAQATKTTHDTSVATAWADLTVRLMTKTRYNTPTYGSRALGYIGLTMYETVVYASSKHRSVARKLSDSLLLPKPPKKENYCPELALNAGQAYIVSIFYGFANKQRLIDSLEKAILNKNSERVSILAVKESVAYGKAVAARIYIWSKSDGGDSGWDRNFPQDYVRPEGQGLWVPPIVGQSNTKIPMHPTWGQNRTFSARNSKLPLPQPLRYAEDSTSEYYKQYKEVFERKKTLTDADRNTVMWWGDDPHETCSPPGHSYNLATIAIRNTNTDLVKAAQTYASVGMAVADAFVCCWKTKFTFMVERPVSYINKKIYSNADQQGTWLPFFLEPPFPSFYSGHAVQSAATATVLTKLYGDSFAFTDDTHANRKPSIYYVRKPLSDKVANKPKPGTRIEYINYEMTYLPRPYKSFWEAAQECAASRLMGGIHTRHDNEIGLQEGAKIGKNINTLCRN